jgi:hypothetical protein
MSWLSNFLSGGGNPADAAMPYLNQIPEQTEKFQQPWFQAGQNALPILQNQYDALLNSPGKKMNAIGEDFQQSPGFQFAMQQALQGGNHAAAAGGMAGSPQHEQQNMQLATNLGNQEYNNWLQNALGLYGAGLSGEQGLSMQGQQAGQNMADTRAQTLAQQANLQFQGQRQQNQNKNDLWGSIAKGIGSVAAFNPWGAFGNI